MKRSPLKLVMIVLAYLAAGAVANLIVAAGCALWMPLSRRCQVEFVDLPSLAVRWTPSKWLDQRLDPSTPGQEFWYSFGVKKLSAIGVSVLEVEGRFVSRRSLSSYKHDRILVFRAGWPGRCLESGSTPTMNPMYQFGNPVAHATFQSTLELPWQRQRVHAANTVRYPLIDLSNVTRNFIPLSPVWPAMIANTIVWALILAFFIHAPRRVRAALRLRRGLCPRCAYPIGVSANCTECGHLLPRLMIQMRMPEGAAAPQSPSGTSRAENQTDRGAA